MNYEYYQYLKSTGQIISQGNINMDPTDFGYQLGVVDARNQYVDPADDTLKDRPLLALSLDKTTVNADFVDFITLSGVSDQAKVTINGPMGFDETQTADGSDIIIRVQTPGTYTITVDLFPYRIATVQFDAV